MELLRDSIWQFVGVLIALLAAVITILIFRAQQLRREISFGVLSNRNVITVDSELTGRMQITLDGEPVQNVHLIVIALKNTGNTAFKENDFSQSIYITFGENSRILDIKVTRQFPDNLSVAAEHDDQRICIRPLLINSGEYLVIQALVSAPSPKPQCDVRAQGVTSLATLTRKPSVRQRIWSVNLALLSMVATTFAVAHSGASFSLVKLIETTGLSFDTSNIIGSVLTTVFSVFIALIVYWLWTRFSERRTRFIEDA